MILKEILPPLIVAATIGLVGASLKLWNDVAELKRNSPPNLSDFAKKSDIPKASELSEVLFRSGNVLLTNQKGSCPDGFFELGVVSIASDPGAKANFEKHFELHGELRSWNKLNPVICIFDK